MADTSNLSNFLEDVANAIRTKKETTDKIPAEQFDQEILSIETGIDTSDATAIPNDIVKNKIAYNADGKVVGTLEAKVYYVNDYTELQTLASGSDLSLGDVAVVNNRTIRSGLNDKINKFYFPETITLPRQVTEDITVNRQMQMSHGGGGGNTTISSTGFRFFLDVNMAEAGVNYTSTDGLTYTRESITAKGTLYDGLWQIADDYLWFTDIGTGNAVFWLQDYDSQYEDIISSIWRTYDVVQFGTFIWTPSSNDIRFYDSFSNWYNFKKFVPVEDSILNNMKQIDFIKLNPVVVQDSLPIKDTSKLEYMTVPRDTVYGDMDFVLVQFELSVYFYYGESISIVYDATKSQYTLSGTMKRREADGLFGTSDSFSQIKQLPKWGTYIDSVTSGSFTVLNDGFTRHFLTNCKIVDGEGTTLVEPGVKSTDVLKGVTYINDLGEVMIGTYESPMSTEEYNTALETSESILGGGERLR